MDSAADKDAYFVAVQDAVTKDLGFTLADQDDSGGYSTRMYVGEMKGIGIAHYVIVKTDDGRWVNVWHGKGSIN